MVIFTTIIKTNNDHHNEKNLTYRNYGIYTIKLTLNNVYMLQNALFAMLNILDKLKPNSQPCGELTAPTGINQSRNLTMTFKALFELSC